jgi:hypothetical protein
MEVGEGQLAEFASSNRLRNDRPNETHKKSKNFFEASHSTFFIFILVCDSLF